MPEVLINARPELLIDGAPAEPLKESLLELLVVENVNGLYRCEAVFSNWGEIAKKIDFLYFGEDMFDFGSSFKVVFRAETLFEGRITGIEAHFPEGNVPQLTILAEDRLQDLRMTRRTRTFPQGMPAGETITDRRVLEFIAGEYGLEARVNVDGPEYKILAQLNQSDLAFLRERVRSIDAELWIEGNTLHASSRSRRGTSTFEMTYEQGLRSFSVLADLSAQRTSITVSGWDRASKTGIASTATEESITGRLGGGRTGTGILASTFGERNDAVVHTSPQSNAEADAIVNAYMNMAARRFVVGRGIAEPNGKIRVGNLVKLNALGPLFSGTYYLSEVQHIFNGVEGMRTEFTAERPDLGS